MSTEPPLPSATPTREEIARIEVGHTNVTPGVRRALVWGFLAAIGIVPLVEIVAGAREDTAASAWSHLAALPVQAGRHLAGADPQTAGTGDWRRIISANRQVLSAFSEFERALDQQSVLGRAFRRPAQALLTGALGAGNERVYPGRDGWLFYRPDVEYVTGPGFLDPAQARRRVAAADEWSAPPSPDPREALLDFERNLEARGITLVLMPTPVKPGVHPEMLAAGAGTDGDVLQNPSYDAFVSELRDAGLLIFDPGRALAAARRGGPQYLLTDTHWRPEAMEAIAGLLAGFIRAHVPLPDVPDPGLRVQQMEVRNTGDTARMLDLPEGRDLFPPETVWLRRILQPDGTLWRSSREADVLLLGDSFSNIYSLESMAWGTSAGFAEQLAYTLRRPIDRIVQNDEAAFATRAILRDQPGRLDGKRVVIYQFAARELAFGDWRILPLPATHAGSADPTGVTR